MPSETDREFLERMRKRVGFPTREDVVRLDRMRREGGGEQVPNPWPGSDAGRPFQR
jgi:hypothetical protein